MTGFGIIVSAETTDTHIKDNTYMNNVLGDVSLSAGPPPSFENTVNEAPGTVIIDNGVNNKIN